MRFEPAEGGSVGDVDMILGLREKGRFYVKGGTEVGGGEGAAVSRILDHKSIEIAADFVLHRTQQRKLGTYLEEQSRSR